MTENSDSIEQPNREDISSLVLNFALDKKTRLVKADFNPGDQPCNIDMQKLKMLIEQAGFSRIETRDPALIEIVRKLKAGESGALDIGKLPLAVTLSFAYDPASRILHAVLTEAESAPSYTFISLKKQLEDEGYTDFDIKATNLSEILLKIKHRAFGSYAIGKKPEFTKITYIFDEKNGELYADLSFSEEQQSISRDSIKDNLRELGFGDFFFKPNTIEKLLAQVTKNDRGRYLIAEKRDATIKIEFDDEFMNAYMTVTPPQGGKELDDDILTAALDKLGIYRDLCDEAVIEQIIKEKSADKVLFAQGVDAKNGVDARFEALVEEVEYAIPIASKSGKIDLKDIVNFTLIEANVPVMRRIPAVHGVNGRNVKGQVIPAVEAIDTPFIDDLVGTMISEHDPNLLVSSHKGHPVILAHGVRVDNTVTVNNVDISTGNINYDGSILIKGEVRPGMKVKVTGDIIVKGVVSKATLIAKNSITVECGIIGSDPSKDGIMSPPAIIKAGGNITAQYINLAEVIAGGDVIVKEYISHCNTEAKHKVLVGQSGGKGKIFGGSCYGQAGVLANALGATGDIKTLVRAGIPNHQLKPYEQLVKAHAKRKEKSEKLQKMLEKFETLSQAKAKQEINNKKVVAIKKVLADMDTEITKMATTISKIGALFKEFKYADVRIKTTTYPNATISINGAEFQIRQESKGGIFSKEGSDIRWRNFSEKK